MTRDILTHGTPVQEPGKRLLRAGALEATFDNGALRRICWNHIEVMRAVLFLVRTPGWGTPAATLSGLSITEDIDRFDVRYRAHFGETAQGVWVDIHIAGLASGSLRCDAVITAETPFETNRSGFVVLHPLDGFAGTEVSVDHASGETRVMRMPLALSPGQPVMDMAGITHHPAPGLDVQTRFEGDVFEMEDHRQWSDASFKTYNRPIGLPYPYTLSPAEPIKQAVELTITDAGIGETAVSAIESPAIAGQRLPLYALPLDQPSHVLDALEHVTTIRALAPGWLLLRHDGTRDALDHFTSLAQLLKDSGAELELHIILGSMTDEAANDELAAIARALASAGVSVTRVAAFAKIDEQSFQPGEERPPHPGEAGINASLALHFPGAVLIGGTPAFFTEFNRKRPDAALWQALTFATSPVVHAADDASVMESLQSLPHILESAIALAQGRPLSIGPVGIGMRINPYGPAPVANDAQAREEMAARDPRQRGLFAAAWTVGYLAAIAPYDVAQFSFGAPTGPFGIIASAQDYARPGWDEDDDGALYPLYHVARWVAAAGGAILESAAIEARLARVVWRQDKRRYALLANLSAQPQPVPDMFKDGATATLLNADRAIELSRQAEPETCAALPAQLDSYAVLHLEAPEAV